MSLKGSKKVDTNRYELEVSIDAESFQNAIREAYRKNSKKINVPGFRKGKAPLSIIEKFYGEEVFFEDALNLIYSDALDAAINEAGLKFVEDKIDFDLVSISKAEGVEFKATITTYPEVELGTYKGLKVEKVTPVVTDEEVDEEIGRMADRNARVVAVEDRAAENGDITTIDFEGFVDGVPFDGGKAEGHTLALGSNQFIHGFEDQIIGHNVGDEFDVNVEFPAEYHAENLAGKPAVFKVKLHEIKKRELPAIDDEFAKDVSEFDTLADLKADLKAKTLERKTATADEQVENDLIDQLIDGMKAEIPEAMFERRVDESLRDFDYRLQSQGMNLETYMQYLGNGDINEFRKNFRPQAERSVKVRLALEKIVELENIVPTEEDIAAEFDKLAEQYNMEATKIKAMIPETELVKDIAVSKAIAIVKDSADIKEVEKKSEAAAKKPAAKKTTTTKSTTTKKTTSAAKKTAEGETAAKKPAAKKTTSTTKKTAEGEKKPAAKKTTASKSTTAKKTTTKKTAEENKAE